MIRSFKPIVAGVATLILSGACSGGGIGVGADPGQGVAPAASSAATGGTGSASAVPSRSTDLVADVAIGGGRTMHIVCVGPIAPGRPTVIFESGLGGGAGQWGDVIHELGGEVRACAYDRAGDGQSPAATIGRTTSDQVADLRALLTGAKVPPPYLLVGFSVGGWNVLVQADQYADDVVGAVLAEVRPPEASARWLAALPPASASESEAIHLGRWESTTFDTDPTLNPEGLDLRASAAEADAARGLEDKPLIVLAASNDAAISEGFDSTLGTTMTSIWWELQASLAKRSTHGRLDKVDGTDHEMPVSRPDAVADAIREILGD